MVKPLEEENFERRNGGGRWIRTIEVSDSRFTVCPLWPLGNPTTTLERVKGIEPSQSAWKADVLPLNYTRLRYVCNILRYRIKSNHFLILF